jgi:sigma-B regulation protein RsbU (phosphoserine phosphatase)
MLVGDVSGKGVAAAALTALLRYTARAAAFHASGPADVMQELNTAVLTTGPDIAAAQGQDGLTEAFATAIYAETGPSDEGVEVRLACGGHPPPVLRTADGVVRTLDVGGSAVGLFSSAVFREYQLRLRRDDVLVLFTDGYVEARSSESGWAADDLVARIIAGAGDVDADTLAGMLESAVVDFQRGDPRDDMALLVLRAL